MAEFASKGVAGTGLGLGIAGTALGILNGGLGNLLGSDGLLSGLGRNASSATLAEAIGPFENNSACQHDLTMAKELMAKDAQIAKLESERYADSVGLKLYEFVGGELKDIRSNMELNKDSANAQFAQQAVYNATANGAIATINTQVNQLNTIIGEITQSVVPSSVVCNTGCNSCCGVTTI